MPSYLDNLCRMAIVDSSSPQYLNTFIGNRKQPFQRLVELPEVADLIKRAEEERREMVVVFAEEFIITSFGYQFIQSCVLPHDAGPITEQGEKST